MKIVNLTEEGTRNLLENMLKRSPSQYGDYENKVKTSCRMCRRGATRRYLNIQRLSIM